MNSLSKDKALGLDRPIARRDFLNGVAIALGAIGGGKLGIGKASAETGLAWPQDEVGYYPPSLTGLRGSHPGSFPTLSVSRTGTPRSPASWFGI
jgi:spermidine dehydrogenase